MASGWISKATRKAIYARDNMVCCYCGKTCEAYSKESWKDSIRSKDIATLDHIVSQWAIAQTCESDAHFRKEIRAAHNLVTVCNGCNSSKKHTELYIWCATKGLDYARILHTIAERISA